MIQSYQGLGAALETLLAALAGARRSRSERLARKGDAGRGQMMPLARRPLLARQESAPASTVVSAERSCAVTVPVVRAGEAHILRGDHDGGATAARTAGRSDRSRA
ncbi:MAG: hypothetical protein R2853_19070 [Thermomicrobiales bacterium]